MDRAGARLRAGRARAPGLSVRKAGRALRGSARHVADAAVPGGVLDAGGAGSQCADRRAGRRVRGHAGNGNRIRPDDEPASRWRGLRRRAADARRRAGAGRGGRGGRTVPGGAGPAADAAGRCAAGRRGRAVGRAAAGMAGGVRDRWRACAGGVRPRVAAVGQADGRQCRARGCHRARDAQLRGAAGPGGPGRGRTARARRPHRRPCRIVLADGARRTGGAARRVARRGDLPAARSRRAGGAAARDPVASGTGAARARRHGGAAGVARMRGDRVRHAWRRARRRAARVYRSAAGRLYAVHVRLDRRAEGRRRQSSGGRAQDPGAVRRVSDDGRRPGRAVLVARVRRVDRGDLHDAVRRRLSAVARSRGMADARCVQRPARRAARDRAQSARVVLARMGACDPARRGRAAGATAPGRDGQRDGAARGGAGMACRDGRPRGADERVRADGKRDHVRRARRAGRRAPGRTRRADRRAAAGHHGLCARRAPATGAAAVPRRALPRRQRARERLPGPARADGRGLPARSVRRPAGRAHVSHRRPRASRRGRRAGLPRPERSPDQGARGSRRPGRGGGAAARPGRRARGGGAAVERARRAGAAPGGVHRRRPRRVRCAGHATRRGARAAARAAPRRAGASGAACAGNRAVAAQDVRRQDRPPVGVGGGAARRSRGRRRNAAAARAAGGAARRAAAGADRPGRQLLRAGRRLHPGAARRRATEPGGLDGRSAGFLRDPDPRGPGRLPATAGGAA
ncbi:hypothetical protein BLA15816_08173 [Burkholderia lata]|nr:hypothetical protein BLA15816_08173 [Burkholderia lata]